MYADRRDAGAGAQLSSSRDRRDGGAGAHLPLLTGVVQMRPGARTDVGPPLRFLTSGPSLGFGAWAVGGTEDRKSTRLNSSHLVISYAVFCLKKKNNTQSHESIFGDRPFSQYAKSSGYSCSLTTTKSTATYRSRGIMWNSATSYGQSKYLTQH